MNRFQPLQNPTSWRKIAASIWRKPNDSHIFAYIDVDATAAMEHIQALQAKGVKATLTHLVAQAVAHSIRDIPEINAKVHWGRILLRDTVDIFLQVVSEDGRDLSGVKVERTDQKTLAEIADEISSKSKKIREGKDPTLAKSRGMFQWMPNLFLRPMLWLSDFLVHELHLNLTKQGMPPDTFGSAMVTSMGMFGIDTAWAPLVPIARSPIIILISQVTDRPWVERGQLVVRPILRLCGTFDHRVLDGYYGARFGRNLKKFMESPSTLDMMAKATNS